MPNANLIWLMRALTTIAVHSCNMAKKTVEESTWRSLAFYQGCAIIYSLIVGMLVVFAVYFAVFADESKPEVPPADLAFQEDCLTEHNKIRANHAQNNLRGDENLRDEAKKQATSLLAKRAEEQEEGEDKDGEEGVNSYKVWTLLPPKTYKCSQAVFKWYEEEEDYDFITDNAIPGTESFTQMVWKKTQYLGCGYASNTHAISIVCLYKPKGNIDGQFPTNVESALFVPPYRF